METNKEIIAIVNPKQATMYMKNGCKCLKCQWENDKVVYYFNRKETYPLYVKWMTRELS